MWDDPFEIRVRFTAKTYPYVLYGSNLNRFDSFSYKLAIHKIIQPDAFNKLKTLLKTEVLQFKWWDKEPSLKIL